MSEQQALAAWLEQQAARLEAELRARRQTRSATDELAEPMVCDRFASRIELLIPPARSARNSATVITAKTPINAQRMVFSVVNLVFIL